MDNNKVFTCTNIYLLHRERFLSSEKMYILLKLQFFVKAAFVKAACKSCFKKLHLFYLI